MPVIRHEAIACDAYPSPVVDQGQHFLTHGVVVSVVKQRESTDAVVEHMIGMVSGDLYGFRLPQQERTDHCNLTLAKLPDPSIAKQTDYPKHEQFHKDEQP